MSEIDPKTYDQTIKDLETAQEVRDVLYYLAGYAATWSPGEVLTGHLDATIEAAQDRIVQLRPGDSGGTPEPAEAELARLREHAIQLPEDWRQQIDQVARANLGWYPQLVDAITALVESWRTATHPTPQGVMPIECDGGPYCEATKHYDFCQRRPAPETSEPREDWYPQIGDKVEAIADGEIMTVIPRQPMMAKADGFVHVESEHGQRWYLTPDTLRPVVVPTGEDTPDA